MCFLFVDRIVQLSPGEYVKGIKHITKEDTYLCLDEQGKLIFIPSLIGETLGQLAAWNVMFHNNFTLRPVAGVVASARLHRPARLGETLVLESYIDSLDDKAVQYHSVARAGEELVFSIEGALGPLLPMTEFIDGNDIRKQFAEIYRPDDCFNATYPSQELNFREPIVSGPIVAPLTFDRILASEPGISLIAEKRITRAASWFSDHFPNNPVLPMTVLLECKLNLAREFVARAGYSLNYQVNELRKIKMNEFVRPGDVLVCSMAVKKQTEDELVLAYRSEVNGKRVCVVEVVLHPINFVR